MCISNVPTTTNLAEIQNIFKTFGSIEVKLCALINFPSKEQVILFFYVQILHNNDLTNLSQADSFINTYDQYNLNGTDIQVSLKENKYVASKLTHHSNIF